MRGAVMSCAQMAGSWPERLDHKTVAELSRSALRPRRCDNLPNNSAAAKRSRLERIVRRVPWKPARCYFLKTLSLLSLARAASALRRNLSRTA